MAHRPYEAWLSDSISQKKWDLNLVDHYRTGFTVTKLSANPTWTRYKVQNLSGRLLPGEDQADLYRYMYQDDTMAMPLTTDFGSRQYDPNSAEMLNFKWEQGPAIDPIEPSTTQPPQTSETETNDNRDKSSNNPLYQTNKGARDSLLYSRAPVRRTNTLDNNRFIKQSQSPLFRRLQIERLAKQTHHIVISFLRIRTTPAIQDTSNRTKIDKTSQREAVTQILSNIAAVLDLLKNLTGLDMELDELLKRLMESQGQGYRNFILGLMEYYDHVYELLKELQDAAPGLAENFPEHLDISEQNLTLDEIIAWMDAVDSHVTSLTKRKNSTSLSSDDLRTLNAFSQKQQSLFNHMAANLYASYEDEIQQSLAQFLDELDEVTNSIEVEEDLILEEEDGLLKAIVDLNPEEEAKQ